MQRKARSKAAERPVDPSLPRLKAALYPVDQDELAAVEEKIALHREALMRRLADDAETETVAMDEAARERLRQVAKRATAAMADMAERTPRFAEVLAAPAPSRWRRQADAALAG